MTRLLLIFFFISQVQAFADDDVITTPLRKSLAKLAQAGDPLAEMHRPGLNCNDQTRAVRCANLSAEVDSDYSDAQMTLNRLRSEVAAYVQKKEISNNSLLRDEVRAVATVLRCMYDRYDHLSIECTSNHGGKIGKEVGTTPLDVNAYMSQNNKLSPNLITLGPSYFLYAKTKRTAILIHELSHFCGTADLEYYLTSRGPEKISTTPFTQLERHGNFLTGHTYKGEAGSSALNGDNYALWAVNGFCVPAFDCKN